VDGPPPFLSEPFATISLGALATPEVRLLTDAYLDDTGISFTPGEVRAIAELSAAHPAYVQRAAFHLFESKLDPTIDWRAAYLAEARSRPVPGAPLPPAVFEGQQQQRLEQSAYGQEGYATAEGAPQQFQLPEVAPALAFILPLLAGALVLAVAGSPLLALAVAVVGLLGVRLWQRWRRA
jgi:hypothetical protein